MNSFIKVFNAGSTNISDNRLQKPDSLVSYSINLHFISVINMSKKLMKIEIPSCVVENTNIAVH